MLMQAGETVLVKGACAGRFKEAFESFGGSSGIGVVIFCNGCGKRFLHFDEFVIEDEAVASLDGGIKISLKIMKHFQIVGADAEL